MRKSGDILKELIDNKGISRYELSNESGVSESTLSRILSSNSKMSSKTLKLLSKYFKVSNDYLRTGYKNERNNQVILNEPETPYYQNKNGNEFNKIDDNHFIMKVPLIEIPAQAGFCESYGQVNYITSIDSFHTIIVQEPHKGKYLAFRVKGDSMDSGTSSAITPNSIVTVRELKKEHWRNRLKTKDFPYWIICHKENSYPLLKEITNHDTNKGVITCHSTNNSPEYVDFDLYLDDITSLFYVVDISRPINRFNQNYDY